MASGTEVLLDEEVWPRLKELAARGRRRPALVVVPYLTSDLLELKTGDVLGVDMSPATLGAGQTDPRVLQKYRRRGVLLHSCPGVHAKVYVFGGTAVVGSMNMSRLSESTLREAAMLTTDPAAVAAVRDAGMRFLGPEITQQELTAAKALYRPGRGAPPLPRRPSKQHPAGPPATASDRVWLLRVWTEWWPESAYTLAVAAQRRVRRRAGLAAHVEMESVLFDRPNNPAFQLDDVLLLARAENTDGDVKEVSYPARVIEVVPVPGRGRWPGGDIVYVRRPAGKPSLPWTEIRAAASGAGARLPSDGNVVRRLRSESSAAVLRLWHL